MTFFTFLRFTEQQNMLQQQLKEALSKHSHIWNSSKSILGLSQRNELLLLDAFRRVLV